MALRQQILVLYLENSALDARVVSWAFYDGTGASTPMSGDTQVPPFRTGVDALVAGWRLLQMSPLVQHAPGAEFVTGYQKYEFVFEQLVDTEVSS